MCLGNRGRFSPLFAASCWIHCLGRGSLHKVLFPGFSETARGRVRPPQPSCRCVDLHSAALRSAAWTPAVTCLCNRSWLWKPPRFTTGGPEAATGRESARPQPEVTRPRRGKSKTLAFLSTLKKEVGKKLKHRLFSATHTHTLNCLLSNKTECFQ